MSDTKDSSGPLFAVFLVFLILKLVHVIDWSWWWVTAPLWIPLVIVGAVLLVFFTGCILVGVGTAAFAGFVLGVENYPKLTAAGTALALVGLSATLYHFLF